MISKALTLLIRELNTYIDSVDQAGGTGPAVAELGNIALIENGGGNGNLLSEKIVLSLVNIEEEKRLKNSRNYVSNGNQVEYVNPPININLYLLFSANFDIYTTALKRLSQVIEFFQGKYVFTVADSPNSGYANDPQMKDLKLVLDIHTLNFEQINDLWGSLGGKQVPFVMYRTRLLLMRRDATLSTAPSIVEINESANE